MSRKAASTTTRSEDALIATTLMILPFSSEYSNLVSTRVSSLLIGRGAGPGRSIEKFVEKLVGVLEVHAAFVLSEDHDRAALKRKYQTVARAVDEASEAIFALSEGEYMLLQKHSRLNAEGRREPKPVEVGRGDLYLALSYMCASAKRLVRDLSGTKQDRTRADRYLVHELMRHWLKAGMPRPALVRDAHPDDLSSPDPDPFSEMLTLVFDYSMKAPPKPDAVRHMVRDALAEFTPRENQSS